MPYPVNKSDGQLLTTVQDYTKDNTASSITLLGRGVVDYGEVVAENFVHMLEHFASSTPPVKPIEGQMWFQTYDSESAKPIFKIKIFSEGQWKNVGGAEVSETPPDQPQPGDLWYNPETKKIYYWNGRQWIPINAPNTGTPPDGHDDDGEIDPTIPWEPPLDPIDGELWWMLPERQLWAFDKSLLNVSSNPPDAKRVDGKKVPNGWVLVGPLSQRPDGAPINYISYTNVFGEDGEKYDILKIVINGELIGVFTESPVVLKDNSIDDMSFDTYDATTGTSLTLRPGLNLNHTFGATMHGTASNADLFDGLDSTAFLRRDRSDFPVETAGGVLDLGKPESKWRRFFAKDVFGGDSTPEKDDTARINLHGKSSAAALADKATHAETADRAKTADTVKAMTSGKSVVSTGDVSWTLSNFLAGEQNNYTVTSTLTAAGIAKVSGSIPAAPTPKDYDAAINALISRVNALEGRPTGTPGATGVTRLRMGQEVVVVAPNLGRVSGPPGSVLVGYDSRDTQNNPFIWINTIQYFIDGNWVMMGGS